MQNLYMMAVQIREQEMRKMAIQITKGLLSIEQAMLNYNVSTEEAVLKCVKDFKRQNTKSKKSGSKFTNMNIQAA